LIFAIFEADSSEMSAEEVIEDYTNGGHFEDNNNVTKIDDALERKFSNVSSFLFFLL